jgi:hypothetical protein
MRLRFLFLLSFFQLAFSAVQGQTNPDPQNKLRGFSMSQDFQFDGLKYTNELRTKDVVDTPSWNPSQADPPLSVRKAATGFVKFC